MIRIAPSILSADFVRLADAVALVEGCADMLHVDVMDGRFVPNLTIGPPVIKALKATTRMPLDCHLMIEDAERWFKVYREAGADWISVHAEGCAHLHRTVSGIAETGAKAGVAINPGTPIEVLDEVLPLLHHVVLMSVNPGFGGQKFIESTIEKTRRLQRKIIDSGLETVIEIDGGVGPENIAALAHAGAAVFVAGNSVFGQDDPVAAIDALRSSAAPTDRS